MVNKKYEYININNIFSYINEKYSNNKYNINKLLVNEIKIISKTNY